MGWLLCGCCPGLRVCVAVCCSVLQCVEVCHDTHTQTWAASAYEDSFLEIRYIRTYIRVYAYTYMYMHTRTCVQMKMCVPGRHRHPRKMPLFRESGKCAHIYMYMHTYTCICIHAHGLKWICAYPGGIRVRCLFFGNRMILQICTRIRVYAYTYMCANVCVQMHMCVPGQHPRTRPLFRKWAPDIPTPWRMIYCASGTCGTAPAVWIGCGVQGTGFMVHGVGCRV